ncbi:MAG: hypothetical protein UY74_C0043G0009 [Candidatus Kaiserbacteria bacterium GW2011_GWC2_52_8b]|uniref:Uncharacterized protein n=2 Tax=Candidatus Kaiseribacteriota TaxID=1752734 RepID=A0A0G1XHH6_9BACT|nr:MAG: hypothetical protein UY67_C0035G0009 [Candidatus Kaiserbacteria bacterium GW2011_GWA2_52_12]KKW30365.1 MAG: hypothetical protein UY74_C0043G0009 [Candidatus Kaiserbacteria bacterium GW2011_GWC2_52_8b]
MTVIAFTGRLNPDEVERFTKYVTDHICGELHVAGSGTERPTPKSAVHYYFDLASEKCMETRMYFSVEEVREILAKH